MKSVLRANRSCAGSRRRLEAKQPTKFGRLIPCKTQAHSLLVSFVFPPARICREPFIGAPMTPAIEAWLPKSIILLRGYDRHKFVSDLIAGVTVGLVALPLAMAFAIASGLSPQAGLYC